MDWLTDKLEWLKDDNFWVVQIFIVIFAALMIDFVQKRIITRVQAKLAQTNNLWDDAMLHAIRRPASVLIWVLGLTFAVEIIASETKAPIFSLVGPVRSVGVIVVIAWTLVRFIGFAESNIIAQKESQGKKIDRTTADALSKLLRMSVLLTAALVIMQTLGFSISGVLAFGGIGGIAIGFAAKDLLANFFGGLMLYLDRPFAVGDWIRSPDREIEGTVENIGWRLTCIRTFDKRPLYVPNSTFASIAVQNPSRMSHRRIYETIGVRYDDAAEVGSIVNDVEKMLRNHEEIAQDQTLMVNFNAFAPSSLDFFIYTFTRTTNWAKYHQVKQDVLLRVVDIIEKHGAEIAFPTSTIHIASDQKQASTA